LDAVLFNPFFGAPPENSSPSGAPSPGGSYIRSGTINSDLSLKGMWSDLYLQGTVEVSGLHTAVPGLPKELRSVRGKLDFSKKSLRITELRGRYGDGRFQTTGSIALNGLRPVDFDLKFSGDKLYYTNPLFSGLINARLQLFGPFTGPLLSGDVTVEKTRISVGSLRSGSSAGKLDLGFDLNIKAGHEVYFRQYGLANIPLSGGIHVGGTLKKPVLTGEFTADRGSVTVYGDTFRIKEARAEFKPEYLTLPYLELEAELYLSGTEIILSTHGWVGDDLALNLTSNPVMSREEIFALLNWVEGFEESSDQLFVANLVQGNINTVTDTLFGPVIDGFRNLMNIDYFSLEQDRDLGSFRMNLGKSLDDDVYLSYSRGLTDLTEEVWTLEWQISPAFSLIGDFSNNVGYEWQLLYRLMF
jgi:translocation and assembly module TamB